MDQVRYFKEQICDELDGAVCYLKKAIDWYKTKPEWSEKFYTMAEAEEHHATELYKMFMQLYSESQETTYMTKMFDLIMDCFSQQMRKIENCKATYSLMKNGEVPKATSTIPQKGSVV